MPINYDGRMLDWRTHEGGEHEAQALYIVMPAFNEAGRIGDVLAALPSVVRGSHRAYPTRVVVVDDCSSDKTGDVALRGGAAVLQHSHNRGAGAATRTGLLHVLARRDCAFVATIDADGQHATADLTRMVVFAEEQGAAVVVGNRLHAGNGSTMPWHRAFGNRVLDAVGTMMFGLNHVDTQCGLRVFSSEALPVISEFRIDRYGFCTEMLWRAKRARMRIHSLPVAVTYSRDTLIKGQRPWGVFRLIFDLLAVRCGLYQWIRRPPETASRNGAIRIIGRRREERTATDGAGEYEETARQGTAPR